MFKRVINVHNINIKTNVGNYNTKTRRGGGGSIVGNSVGNSVAIDLPANSPLLTYNETKPGKYFWETTTTTTTAPRTWVSLLIPCYNTRREYLTECIQSIKEQVGNFGIELVWINDCSSAENTRIQLELLKSILEPLRNFRLIYQRTRMNRGISFCLHQGVLLCTCAIIMRMDSDDIMLNTRIQRQLTFMSEHPECPLCGTDVIMFMDRDWIKHEVGRSSHGDGRITWADYKRNPRDWILNHPTLCFRRAGILSVGNYRKYFRVPFEDLELELRVLKRYGVVHNIPECLVLYRQHEGQISTHFARNDVSHSLKQVLIRRITA